MLPYRSPAGPSRSRHALLVHGLGVALHLPQRGVTRNGGDLVHATAGLSEAPTRCLAQPMKAAFVGSPEPLRTTLETVR